MRAGMRCAPGRAIRAPSSGERRWASSAQKIPAARTKRTASRLMALAPSA